MDLEQETKGRGLHRCLRPWADRDERRRNARQEDTGEESLGETATLSDLDKLQQRGSREGITGPTDPPFIALAVLIHAEIILAIKNIH